MAAEMQKARWRKPPGNGINQFVFHTNWFLFAKKAQTSPLIASLLF